MTSSPPSTPRRNQSPPLRRLHHCVESDQAELKPLDALWQNGHWWCNCTPRKKAQLRKVRKDTPNKGKYFWSCPGSPSEYCDFFLWQEQAQLREPSSVAQKEPSPTKTPAFRQRPLTSFGVHVIAGRQAPAAAADEEGEGEGEEKVIVVDLDGEPKPVGRATPSPKQSGNKRSRRVFEKLDDAEFSDFASDEERQLAHLADRSVVRPRNPGGDAGSLFPSAARTLFPRGEAKRAKTMSFDLGLPTPTKSPEVKRRVASPPPSSPSEADYDVADKVMTLLRDQPLPAAVLASVNQLLVTSTRVVRGIDRGRHSARAALRGKEETIDALQRQVAELEGDKKSLHHHLTAIKAQLMNIYQEN